MITNTEIARIARGAAKDNTIYLSSGFGTNLTLPSDLEYYTRANDWCNRHAAETRAAAAAASAANLPLWGFDCVCFVKGILWGWRGDATKYRGGAVYASNGVPDATIWDLYTNYSTGRSTDFSNIEIGEFVVLSNSYGHCGLYVGNGEVVESTPAWKNGVQVTKCLNVTPNASGAEHGRTWWAHCKLNFIDYSKNVAVLLCPHCGEKLTINIT